jgi:hypothetical protein
MSNKPKWTPGPWKTVEHSWQCTGIFSDKRHVASVEIDGDVTEDNQDEFEKIMNADARLISVAPEMFEALNLAREQLNHDVPDGCWSTGPKTNDFYQDFVVCPGCAALAKIDAALAKANGEAR